LGETICAKREKKAEVKEKESLGEVEAPQQPSVACGTISDQLNLGRCGQKGGVKGGRAC